MPLRTLVARFQDFERSFLGAPSAIWDVQLAKVMCVILGVVLAKSFPFILSVDMHWLIAGALLAAWFPAARALRLFRSQMHSGKSWTHDSGALFCAARMVDPDVREPK